MTEPLIAAFAAAHGLLPASAIARATGAADLRPRRESGELHRVRRGWYRHRDVEPHPGALRAVAAGGVLTGASALAARGAWDLGRPLEVRAAKHSLITDDEEMRRVVLRTGADRACAAAVDGMRLAFRVAALTLPERDLIIVGDSLANRGLLPKSAMREATADLDPARRQRVERIDGRSDSGTETIVRLWLESLGVRCEPQRRIEGVGDVDLLVGDRLVVEVDSRAHHTGEERHQADRTRDQRLIARGYIVIRVTYADVMHHWDAVAERILAVLRRGAHLGAVA